MKVIRNEEVFAMTQRYENIMVAVDGSKEADLAFIKGVQSTTTAFFISVFSASALAINGFLPICLSI